MPTYADVSHTGVSLENICYAILDLLSKVGFSFLMTNVYVYESVPVERRTRQVSEDDMDREIV
jgi:bacteriorhodopsin